MKRIIILLLIFLSGCAGADVVLMNPLRTYTPTKHVQILFEEPERPFEVIGIMEGRATPYNTQSAAIRAMRKRARKIGAHAIIFTNKETQYVPTTYLPNPVAGSPPIIMKGGYKIIMTAAAIRFLD